MVNNNIEHIIAGESARTGLREYDPSGGVKNIEYAVQVEYTFNDHYSFFTAAQMEQYLGDAADSPLVKDIGTDATAGGVIGLFFRW